MHVRSITMVLISLSAIIFTTSANAVTFCNGTPPSGYVCNTLPQLNVWCIYNTSNYPYDDVTRCNNDGGVVENGGMYCTGDGNGGGGACYVSHACAQGCIHLVSVTSAPQCCTPCTNTCSCSATSQSCTVTGGTGTQTRSNTGGSCSSCTGVNNCSYSGWGTCTVTSCNSGYYKSGNSCVRCPNINTANGWIPSSVIGTTPSNNSGGITSCYITGGTSGMGDSAGTFTASGNCPYN